MLVGELDEGSGPEELHDCTGRSAPDLAPLG
jgi:hypothetical protein